ncbi:MAG: choice-of-anchor I family protein, partial [bacterium]
MAGALVISAIIANTAMAQSSIELKKVGTYATGVFDQGGSEIVAHDHKTQRLFVVNAQAARIHVVDISNPASPVALTPIDVTPYGAVANSVDVHDGVVAVAVQNAVKTDPGKVVFFNTKGQFLSMVQVGALPDILAFTSDGDEVLVANEAEPNDDYTIDPEGSVSIIYLERGARKVTQKNVRTVNFASFNNTTLDPSIRTFGPKATVAQDIEPEYIAVLDDSKLAWVTLQENNAIGVLDIKRAKFKKLIGLGFKDHNAANNGFDASDRDNTINIANWPVKGMYLPDGIAAYEFRDNSYIVTANEGDVREYPGFTESARIGSLALDPTAFPNATALKGNAKLGRLNITKQRGDADNDGDFDELYAFGTRSFSIRTANGKLVFDSGDDFERITAAAFPANFNASNTNNTFDNRSDDKGPEPEGVVLGKIGRRTYAFIGLERISGIMVYDITNPFDVRFIQYINTRDFSGDPAASAAGDLGPEGLIFIKAKHSPNGKPLLVVGNEISGTTGIYEINRALSKESEEELATAELPKQIMLHQNYPNP